MNPIKVQRRNDRIARAVWEVLARPLCRMFENRTDRKGRCAVCRCSRPILLFLGCVCNCNTACHAELRDDKNARKLSCNMSDVLKFHLNLRNLSHPNPYPQTLSHALITSASSPNELTLPRIKSYTRGWVTRNRCAACARPICSRVMGGLSALMSDERSMIFS